MAKGRRAFYAGNGRDDVSESEYDLWDGVGPYTEASRTMQERLLKSTPEDAKELARRLVRERTYNGR